MRIVEEILERVNHALRFSENLDASSVETLVDLKQFIETRIMNDKLFGWDANGSPTEE